MNARSGQTGGKELEERISHLQSENASLMREIAGLRRQEEELKSSQERFKILFDYAPDAYYLSDLMGTFIDGNKAAEEMVGYRKEELIGKSFLNLDLISQLHISKAATLLAKNALGLPTGPDEFILNRKDGTQVVVEVRTYPVKLMGKSLVLGIARDITGRKKNEEALKRSHDELEMRVERRTEELRNSNELLHREIEEHRRTEKELLLKVLLLDNATDSIIVHDPEGRFIYMNEMLYTSRGYTKDELAGMNLRDIITPKMAELFNDRTNRILEKGEAVFESEHICKNGTVIPVEVHARVIEYDGKELIISVTRNITERKLAEEMNLENERLVNANRAKSDFLAKMSHELRTPLNSIIGFSELLITERHGELNEKQERFLRNINSSGQHLLSLIRDILDMTMVEAGKLEVSIERLPLPEAIDETIELVIENAIKSNVIIVKEYDPALKFIEADRQRFRQILLNLLGNAIKFSKMGGGTVTISAKLEKDMVRFSVSDTGVGIKEKDMAKLFREFEQLDSNVPRKYGGAGLGLAISKKLVELHGGNITARSEYGVGTTFTFFLPLEGAVER